MSDAIKAVFLWWDRNENAYWVLALLVLAFVLTKTLSDARQRLDVSVQPPSARSEFLFFGLLLALIFSWRWPYLLFPSEFNSDESQLISGALTLLQRPYFWRAVDGHTAGPVEFYLLTLPGWLRLPVDYFTCRALALILMVLSVWFAYRTLALHVPRTIARVLILPLAVFFAVVIDWEFIHVSTEHIPVFLLALGTYLLGSAAQRDRSGVGTGWSRWFFGGLAAGLVPWAKLQGGPACALLGVGSAVMILGNRTSAWSLRLRRLGVVSLGFALPTLGFLLLAHHFGEWDTLYRSYFAGNVEYVQQPGSIVRSVSDMWNTVLFTGGYQTFAAACLIGVGVSVVLCLRARVRPSRWFYAAVVAALTSVLIALAPRRGFAHYLLFTFVPLGALLAISFADWLIYARASLRGRYLGLILFTASMCLPQVITRGFHGTPFAFGGLYPYWQNPFSPLGQEARRYAHRGETLSVWGWFSQVYVELRCAQATRDAHTQRQIDPSVLREYYRARYLADFRANIPPVFIDAVGEKTFYYHDRATAGHESFPELADIIAREFSLVADLPQGRVYARNDRLPQPKALSNAKGE